MSLWPNHKRSTSQPWIFASAGEPSGDAILAQVLEQMGNGNSYAFRGLGGPLSQAQGLQTLSPFKVLAKNGICDVVISIPQLLWIYCRVLRYLNYSHPKAMLLVDYPGMNLGFLKWGKKSEIPIHYISPPQLWAYRNKARSALFTGVSVQVLYPFEALEYNNKAASVVQGHFLHHQANDSEKNAKASVKKTVSLSNLESVQSKNSILLAPGSRLGLIKRNLPWMIKQALGFIKYFEKSIDASGNVSAKKEWHSSPQNVLIVCPDFLRQIIANQLTRLLEQLSKQKSTPQNVHIRLIAPQEIDESSIQIAFCCPGTFSLELALKAVPLIICARFDALTYLFGKQKLVTPYLGMPNVILNREVYPEFMTTAFKKIPSGQDIPVSCFSPALKNNGDGIQTVLELHKKMGDSNGAQKAFERLQAILAEADTIEAKHQDYQYLFNHKSYIDRK